MDSSPQNENSQTYVTFLSKITHTQHTPHTHTPTHTHTQNCISIASHTHYDYSKTFSNSQYLNIRNTNALACTNEKINDKDENTQIKATHWGTHTLSPPCSLSLGDVCVRRRLWSLGFGEMKALGFIIKLVLYHPLQTPCGSAQQHIHLQSCPLCETNIKQ